MNKKVLLLTHDTLAKAYYETASNFVANLDRACFMGIAISENLEQLASKLDEVLVTMDKHQSFILTDLYLSTSSRLAYQMARKYPNMVVISGCNMKLLIDLLGNDQGVLSEEEIVILIETSRMDIQELKMKK